MVGETRSMAQVDEGRVKEEWKWEANVHQSSGRVEQEEQPVVREEFLAIMDEGRVKGEEWISGRAGQERLPK